MQLLGIELKSRKPKLIWLKSSEIAKNLLLCSDIANVQPVESQISPAIAGEDITISKPLFGDEQQRFRSIIGRFLYLVVKKTWYMRRSEYARRFRGNFDNIGDCHS